MNKLPNNSPFTLSKYEEIINLPVESLNEKQKNTLSVYLIYMILTKKLPLEKINIYPNDIIERVTCVLDHDINNSYRIPLVKELHNLLIDLAIEDAPNFSLDNFLKSNVYKGFPYECRYNKFIAPNKAALGLIFPEHTFYCNFPIDTIHFSVAIRFFEKYDPNLVQKLINDKDWHNLLMKEKNVIIIHFLPNDCGEVIYIPEKITEFQYKELEKVNELLQKYNIEGDTEYSVPLNILIDDEEFQDRIITNNNNPKKY